MAGEVGGQMETVPTPRSLFGPDYGRLFILVLVAVGIHGWLIAKTAIPARDSLGYARIALNFSNPNGGNPNGTRQRIDVIREAEQPPGYPLAIWVTDKLLRNVCELPTPDRTLLATQVANAMAAVLLVVPMYLAGRMLFGRNVGFGAALLFQVLPVPARVTSDGLSEGLYLLATSVAIMFGVRSVQRPGIGGFLLCGMAIGASYLVRPEGVLIGIGVGMVIVAAGLSRCWPRDIALGRLTAMCVGVAFVAVPYMLLIGKFSQKPTADFLIKPVGDPNGNPPAIWKGMPGARLDVEGGGGRALFAAWWDPVVDAGKNRTIWALGAVWSELIKALHYVVGSLTLFGIIAHRRRLFGPEPDWGLWVLFVLSGLSLTLLVYLAARIGYVSERHTVLLVMLCCLLGTSAIEWFVDAFSRIPLLGRIVVWPDAAPATFFVMLVASALPYTLKPMHQQREGHKHAGRWLATQMNEKDWLQDPLAWSEWYAGRTLYNTTHYDGQPDFIWVVVEKKEVKENPHSRLPQWEQAKQRTANQTPVYRWPENAPPEGPAVEVYKIPYQPPPK